MRMGYFVRIAEVAASATVILFGTSGCDSFPPGLYHPSADLVWQTSFTDSATDTTEARLGVALRSFAQKYNGSCATPGEWDEEVTCEMGYGSHVLGDVRGALSVASDGSQPVIRYRNFVPKADSETSEQKYCALLENVRKKLEEFTGPLKLKVTANGLPPFDTCASELK